jgi:hypothetical protein
VTQEVFNLAYHLKQRVDDIMTWPSGMRHDMWRNVLKQYEFEEKERNKS